MPDPQPSRAPIAVPAISDEDEEAAVRAANRLDIRRIIGGLFTLYGVVLVALGRFGAHHVKVKAVGINVNLWTGLWMLVLAGAMIGWALARPVRPGRLRCEAGLQPNPSRARV